MHNAHLDNKHRHVFDVVADIDEKKIAYKLQCQYPGCNTTRDAIHDYVSLHLKIMLLKASVDENVEIILDEEVLLQLKRLLAKD